MVNLDSDTLKPEGWDNLANEKPDILSFSDISIYELHIKDFRYKLNSYCACNFLVAYLYLFLGQKQIIEKIRDQHIIDFLVSI